jgi:hypothetical protein
MMYGFSENPYHKYRKSTDIGLFSIFEPNSFVMNSKAKKVQQGAG